MIRKDASVAVWGFVALAAVILSYLFAAVLGLFCLAVPVAAAIAVVSGGYSYILVAIVAGLFGIIVGVTILRALLPRKSEFKPSGILLDVSKHPELSHEIAGVAESLSESLPSAVYLIAEANAYDAEPQGRAHRIMGIGLPLLQLMTVSEFRGVIAHEMAHYYSGDTRLTPKIGKARESMVRVFQNLGKRSDTLAALSRFALVGLLHMLIVGGLRAVWTGFLRLTQWISRRQEFRSDELACTLCGSGPYEAALLKLNTATAALPSFWQGVVLPVVRQGYQPPLGSSFAGYLAHPAIAASTAKFVEDRISQTSSAAYDTHPPLGARLAAVRALAIPAPETDSRPAVVLLENLSSLEAELLQAIVDPTRKTALKSFTWATAGTDIYIPMWRKAVAPFAQSLSACTITGLSALARDNRRIADTILNPPGILLNAKQRDEQGTGILSIAFALALIDHGWQVECKPGVFILTNGKTSLVAREVLALLRSGELTGERWAAFCKTRAIEDWPLA